MTSSVLLIDDHPTVRIGLGLILSQLNGGVAIDEAPTGTAAIDLLRDHRQYDLILYDWCLPEGGGLNGLLALLQLAPSVPIVVISSIEEEAVRLISLQAGAKAYLPKYVEANKILSVLRNVLGHESSTFDVATVAGPAASSDAIPTDARVAASEFAPRLTPRQLEVLQLIARGLQNKEIAKQLQIAEPTARDHVSDVLAALGAKNRTEAVALARKWGLLLR